MTELYGFDGLNVAGSRTRRDSLVKRAVRTVHDYLFTLESERQPRVANPMPTAAFPPTEHVRLITDTDSEVAVNKPALDQPAMTRAAWDQWLTKQAAEAEDDLKVGAVKDAFITKIIDTLIDGSLAQLDESGAEELRAEADMIGIPFGHAYSEAQLFIRETTIPRQQS